MVMSLYKALLAVLMRIILVLVTAVVVGGLMIVLRLMWERLYG